MDVGMVCPCLLLLYLEANDEGVLFVYLSHIGWYSAGCSWFLELGIYIGLLGCFCDCFFLANFLLECLAYENHLLIKTCTDKLNR